jgi:hypothetical protein
MSTRRPLVTLGFGLMMVCLLVLFFEGMRARGSASDRHRRAQEIEAREVDLYRQLTDKAAVLESQRQIYIARFRRLEAQIREKEQDIFILRARLMITSSPGGGDPPADVKAASPSAVSGLDQRPMPVR